ncbi:PREDICTED: Niemann-Pick C1-like protein 1, partial [Mesitornis unicolor]|uniref:Niemann-Pick C1-like protein 1 n=1 Tax=Mesitornis unicolor TaxID=54374 RepID=UPI00052833AF
SPLSFKDITALELSCMADYGGPVFPYIAFGGYPGSEYTEAQALILTYSLTNFPRQDPRHQWVLSWEQRFLELVGDFQRTHGSNLSVTFMAERSLEDEINRTTAEDIPIFTVSYLVVFIYIALALGEYTAWRRVLVVPFLVLAVGADNIFIFVQEYQVGGTGGVGELVGHFGDTLGAGLLMGQ